ncbi:hypothetical protein CDAR_381901 [Caerostris darwini]|uniref:Uncharacterized protein n=1 Tax=Caerostris darwini TaxID=1538125 RepID=A0AAV4V6I3_9ARAC|nr:hypothetical protein CDAR_381901 [Caerostris darwini]
MASILVRGTFGVAQHPSPSLRSDSVGLIAPGIYERDFQTILRSFISEYDPNVPPLFRHRPLMRGDFWRGISPSLLSQWKFLLFIIVQRNCEFRSEWQSVVIIISFLWFLNKMFRISLIYVLSLKRNSMIIA